MGGWRKQLSTLPPLFMGVQSRERKTSHSFLLLLLLFLLLLLLLLLLSPSLLCPLFDLNRWLRREGGVEEGGGIGHGSVSTHTHTKKEENLKRHEKRELGRKSGRKFLPIISFSDIFFWRKSPKVFFFLFLARTCLLAFFYFRKAGDANFSSPRAVKCRHFNATSRPQHVAHGEAKFPGERGLLGPTTTWDVFWLVSFCFFFFCLIPFSTRPFIHRQRWEILSLAGRVPSFLLSFPPSPD